jgi:hypothetical protein
MNNDVPREGEFTPSPPSRSLFRLGSDAGWKMVRTNFSVSLKSFSDEAYPGVLFLPPHSLAISIKPNCSLAFAGRQVVWKFDRLTA